MHYKDTFTQGFDLINTYIEQNISNEMLKSTVIKVFGIAINSWNMSILQAAQCAADVSGVAVYTARKWVATYYLSLIDANLDNVDQDFINDLVTSEKSRACENPNSLLHDEEFRVNARDYIHANAYNRGQPSLTTKDFQDCIASEYSVNVAVETAI